MDSAPLKQKMTITPDKNSNLLRTPMMERARTVKVQFEGQQQGKIDQKIMSGGVKINAKSNFDGIEEISDEEGVDIDNRLKQFVEYFKVQDKALIGSVTNMVRIKDPITGLLIASIRDPKVDINPYSNMSGIINM